MIFITNESELNFNNGICALYFYADWLLFHKKSLLMIKGVESERNVVFYAIDIGSLKNLTKRFKIDTIPTFTILVNGKELKRLTGVHSSASFSKVFDDIYETYGEENGKV